MKMLSESGKLNFGACLAMLVFATIAVLTRFLVRKVLRQIPTVAEWLCLLSLLLLYGYCVPIFYYVFESGSGGEFEFAKIRFPDDFTLLLKMVYVTEIMFGAVITSVKLSILLFYHAIFSVNRTFTLALKITGAVSIIWSIVFTFIVVFQCSPIHAYWDSLASPMYCKPSAKVLLGYELTNLFIDATILLLPLFVIRNLHLPIHRKMSVAGIFLLGGFVCVTSIIRLTFIWVPPNFVAPPSLTMIMFWSTMQLGVALICSCLPTYGPLFSTTGPVAKTFKNLYSSFSSQKGQSSTSGASWKMPKTKRSGGSSRDDVERMSWQQIGNQSFSLHHANSKSTSNDDEYPMVPTAPKTTQVV
ncbi:hypothetical protein P154DRAFT_623670 [Amniculicola lignicola CBS 123094]|uniref:Rhodopsin domain-containing protein n=1 Tax=Amniculicola lignicola CBS 123094 TaxID=1392246 RepID=A0A6A5W286_9PLEO|nr:hypothetical protein P154DRAFT_623670 [Amniculicola lignicola CBS 123094]